MCCARGIKFYHDCGHVVTTYTNDPDCKGGHGYDDIYTIPSEDYQMSQACKLQLANTRDRIPVVVTELQDLDERCRYCEEEASFISKYDRSTIEKRRHLWRQAVTEHQERAEEATHDERRARRRQEWYQDYARHYAKEMREHKHFTQRTYIYDPESNASTAFLVVVDPRTMDPDDVCGICRKSLDKSDPRWLPCGHIIHLHCIRPWLGDKTDRHDSCPSPYCKCEFNILRPITWDDPVSFQMPGAMRRVQYFGYIRFKTQKMLAKLPPYPGAVVLERNEKGLVEYRRYEP